jgi:3-oxoacyl-[acyl-carrier-protein] synthase-1
MPIDYINAHGTSTPVGDTRELEAIKATFADRNKMPHVSSTKSLAGHSQGATGVHEVIYSLLMMENNFVCASSNIENLDPDAEDVPVVQKRIDDIQLNCVLSNSFGFGGTNAALAFKRYDA